MPKLRRQRIEPTEDWSQLELLDVAERQPYDTPHRSPQPPLWELGDGEWLRVLKVPEYAPRRRVDKAVVQAGLLA